tara:strand:+ start:3241 stop:3942 length:702 start_codon:yes stop_codon:yes gene_type:complete
VELCILIPAKNESETLPGTIANLHIALSTEIDYNILVVNDHSDDNTLEVLEELSQQYPTLNYVDNDGNPGVGNGIRFGLDRWKGDIIAICMADGSDAPRDILESYRLIAEEHYDCAFGSRFMKGASVSDYPMVKLILNRIFNNMVKVLSGNKYNDFTNIFKVYHRRVIEGIQPLQSTAFSIGLEMSLKAYNRGYRIAIIPISWTQRTAGKSKLNLRKNFNAYVFTLKNCLRNA